MAKHPSVQYVQFYTAGSAACKVATVEQMPTAKLPRVKKRKHITLYIDPVATAGIVMATVMLVLMLVGVFQLRQAKQEVAMLESQVQTLWQEQRQLYATYEESYDIADVEKTALALGMVPKDQVKQITMKVPPVESEKDPNTWEKIYTFLTGLFA
ncbi:MAG: hypothetical protein J6Q92_07875 [Oscillospiraceae bacterium]|nr:hypothetical protein [Oscillospiraceae bacterium]